MKTAVALTLLLGLSGTLAYWLAGAMPQAIVANHPDRSEIDRSAGGLPYDCVQAVGYVEPVSEIRRLAFKTAGVIEHCEVGIGQAVSAGCVLAMLHDNDQLAALAVADQELVLARALRDKLLSGVHPHQIESAERRVARLQEKVRHAERYYQRQKILLDQKATPAIDFDRAETDLRQATEELQEAEHDLSALERSVRTEDKALAEARIRLAEAHVVAARERLQNTVLTAPLCGHVLKVLKREGEAVSASGADPVIVFGDCTQLRVRAEIDERFVAAVRVGDEATVYGRGLGGRRVRGKVALMKGLMGNKTVFNREAGERKDLDVLQVFVEFDQPFSATIGLQVDVSIQAPPRNQELSSLQRTRNQQITPGGAMP